MLGEKLNYKDCKILVVSRANARDDGKIYFQNLDGDYLDRIAGSFKEVEILAPVHRKGVHPTYERYGHYTYRFKSPNIYVTDMAGVKSYSDNIMVHLLRLYYEMKILKQKIKNADLVYVFMSTFKASMAIRLCLMHRRPFIVYLGTDWERCARFQYRWDKGLLKLGRYPYIRLCAILERWAIKNSPVKIINSPKLYKRYKGFPGYIEEAKPFIQLSPSDSFYRKDTCTNSVIKILTVASVISVKGLEYLIKGFSEAKEKVSNIELYLLGPVGDKVYKERLEKIISANRVGSDVYWCGYVPNGPELFEFYRESDIFVLPSLGEGFPRVIWESMLQCLPIIVTRLESIHEKIGDKGLVHFVIPADSRSIAEGIVKIVKEADYRQRLIRDSYDFARGILQESPSEQFLRIINNEK